MFGSGPLIVRGIIPASNDLDVVCRGAAWNRVRQIGKLQINDDYGVEIVTICNGQVTFGNRWGIGNFDVDELIDDAEYIDELPFVKLEYVVDYNTTREQERFATHRVVETNRVFSACRKIRIAFAQAIKSGNTSKCCSKAIVLLLPGNQISFALPGWRAQPLLELAGIHCGAVRVGKFVDYGLCKA